MPFDPNLPQPNTPADADVIRAQLNALKSLCDGLQAQVTALQNSLNSQIAGTALNPNGQFGNFDPNWQPNPGGWDFNDLIWLRDRMAELYNIEAR